ncbi:hypothetical protein [Streptomyces sp. NPDC127036]|uniref:hypothetical protein n=1 Tax=Streptomyces sp. NPDC127036 TaxID=3347112 RepID=UPI003658482F
MAVVGNEDGAHKVSADLFQALNDVGFSLAPGAVTYWVGEAQQGTDYQDLEPTPDSVTSTTHTLTVNTVHLPCTWLADSPRIPTRPAEPTIRLDRPSPAPAPCLKRTREHQASAP